MVRIIFQPKFLIKFLSLFAYQKSKCTSEVLYFSLLRLFLHRNHRNSWNLQYFGRKISYDGYYSKIKSP